MEDRYSAAITGPAAKNLIDPRRRADYRWIGNLYLKAAAWVVARDRILQSLHEEGAIENRAGHALVAPHHAEKLARIVRGS